MRRNYAGRRIKKSKKKREFAKMLAVWCIVIASVAFLVSAHLAYQDKQPITDLSGTIFTAAVGYLVTYAAKSAAEKVSRNRHGLDPDGKPYNTAPPEEPTGATYNFEEDYHD